MFARVSRYEVEPERMNDAGEEALAQGEPPQITSWPVHNYDAGRV